MKSIPNLLILALLVPFSLTGCGGSDGGEPQATADPATRAHRLESLLGVLAADSLEGRMTGTRGSALAADFIARELESYGLEPAFGDSFFQTVDLVRFKDPRGRERLALAPQEEVPELEILDEVKDVNVGGILWGSDPEKGGEVVVVTAHFDHVGIRAPRPGTPAEAEGDSIYNGADDDASGVVGVLEVARTMAEEGPGDRTVLFLLITGEEMGLLGTRWYLQNPVFPLDSTVANLNVEMLGRPGPEYGGNGMGWLTGFERSTMGPAFVSAGLQIKADPFPDRGLFFASDNAGFAMEGIPAHTLSSSDLHEDYHSPDDEVDRIDFQSMTQVVETLISAVRILAEGEAPQWVEGGKPEAGGGRR